MSVQAISWVLDNSPVESNARLVLLSLANHADARGQNAWPSLELIARESRVAVRTVQRILRVLTEDGRIECVPRGAPDERIPRDRRPNLYHLVMTESAACPTSPEVIAERRARATHERRIREARRNQRGDGAVTQTVIRTVTRTARSYRLSSSSRWSRLERRGRSQPTSNRSTAALIDR